jgi:acyl-CoA thioesterase
MQTNPSGLTAMGAQIPAFLGVGDDYSAIASLSHTVVFHADAAGLDMLDGSSSSSAASPPSAPPEPEPEPRRRRRWFCIEERIDHVSHGRGLAVATLWDVAGGAPVATYMQDGLLRMKAGVRQSFGGLGGVFDKSKGGKL